MARARGRGMAQFWMFPPAVSSCRKWPMPFLYFHRLSRTHCCPTRCSQSYLSLSGHTDRVSLQQTLLIEPTAGFAAIVHPRSRWFNKCSCGPLLFSAGPGHEALLASLVQPLVPRLCVGLTSLSAATAAALAATASPQDAAVVQTRLHRSATLHTCLLGAAAVAPGPLELSVGMTAEGYLVGLLQPGR